MVTPAGDPGETGCSGESTDVPRPERRQEMRQEMPCHRTLGDHYANELQMARSGQGTPLRARLTGGLLLWVFLMLNAAVVLPSLHALWHGDDHDCDHTDCVVLAVAQGKFESPTATPPPRRPMAEARPVATLPPRTPWVVRAGSPPAERAPPSES